MVEPHFNELRNDVLSLYRGEDFRINDKIKIHQPSLGEICEYGEEKYFSMIHIFTAIPSDMKSQLFDSGIDYEKITDFDLFMMLIPGLSLDVTKIIFGDIDFNKFSQYIDQTNDEIILYDTQTDTRIDRYIYQVMSDYLAKVHGIIKKVELAGNEFTKNFLIQESRDKIKKNKDKPFESSLQPLISTMINCEGFKYNHAQVWDMKINAFMDSISRIQKIKHVNYLMQGHYSGTVDLTKVNKKELNWIGEL
jgi:hypothetical protein